MALGEAFSRLKDRPPCVVVTVDHGLRQEAGLETALVMHTAQTRWNMPAHLVKLTPPKGKEAPNGVLDWARRERYLALSEVAKAHGFAVLLTAHHADDQIETLLWRWVRSPTPALLCGMDEVAAGSNQMQVMRPFLQARRSDLERFARKHHLPWMEDPSNADVEHMRSWIRYELRPMLEKRNPNLTDGWLRFLAQATEDQAFLQATARRTMARAQRAGTLLTDRLLASALARWDRALGRRVLREWLGSDTSERLIEAILAAPAGAEFRLGGKRSVRMKDGWLVLSRRT